MRSILEAVGSCAALRGALAQNLPSARNVLAPGAKIADRESNGIASADLRLGEQYFAGSVDGPKDRFVEAFEPMLVEPGRRVAETDDRERMRRQNLPAGLGFEPHGKLLRERDVAAKSLANSLRAEVPQHEPKLERAKSPAKLKPVLHIVDGRVGRRKNELRHDAEGSPYDRFVFDE